MQNLDRLDELPRAELIALGRQYGIERPERMTRVELRDELVRVTITDAALRERSRGWLGVARDLVASVVEAGLHMPDAAKMIRGDAPVIDTTPRRPPVATVTLAEIYATQGHVKRALKMLEQVLEKEPDHEIARHLMDQLRPRSSAPPPSRPQGPSERPALGLRLNLGQGSFERSAGLPREEDAPPEGVPAPATPASTPVPASRAGESAGPPGPPQVRLEPEAPLGEAASPAVGARAAAPEPGASDDETPAPAARGAVPAATGLPEGERVVGAKAQVAGAEVEAGAALGEVASVAEVEGEAEAEAEAEVEAGAALGEGASVAEVKGGAEAEVEAGAAQSEVASVAEVEGEAEQTLTQTAEVAEVTVERSELEDRPLALVGDWLITTEIDGAPTVSWRFGQRLLHSIKNASPKASPVIRVVGTRPSWDGAERVEVVVKVEVASGSLPLHELSGVPFIRSAFGLDTDQGFHPLLIGIEAHSKQVTFRPRGVSAHHASTALAHALASVAP